MSVLLKIENNKAIIEFDRPESKVNLLDFETLTRLDSILDEVAQKKDLIIAIFRSIKPGIFIAGADIKEIENIVEAEDGTQKAKLGQDVMNKIEDLTLPTLALINGVALGGGCELALACEYRVATHNTKIRIGLPEVNLGFVPGFGGTYRLPRMVGLQESLKMILSGKPIDGTKALRIGLFDQLIPEAGLEDHLNEFIKSVVKSDKKHKKFSPKKGRGVKGFLNTNKLGHKVVFRESRKSVMSLSKGFYPAPLKVIDLIQENFYENRKIALGLEARAFGELAITDISKNCVRVFYLSEECKKLSNSEAAKIKVTTVKKCAVVGAGVMGGGIAQLTSSRGIWTRMKDINYEAIALGLQSASKVYGGALKKRKLSKSQVQSGMAKISGAVDYSGFESADIVIEAVVENMDIKKMVFKELDATVKSDAILATNTSALSVEEMASETSDPSRVIGLHFFNPVHRMPLVEIITTPQTSAETLARTFQLARSLGKTPIVVKDSCGFIVNRILLAYINEAGRILEESGEMEAVDNALTEFGMPMGPFRLSDEVGLDVGVKVLKILEEAFGERFKPVEIFETIYEKTYEKNFGKKIRRRFLFVCEERRSAQ